MRHPQVCRAGQNVFSLFELVAEDLSELAELPSTEQRREGRHAT
jgi:hypothetical protein